MSRLPCLIGVLAVSMLSSLFPAFGVENGEPDGTGHPAVGFIMGTLGDPCSAGGQAIGFNGVLIAPDLLLTTGNIALETQEHIDENFFDTAWVILDPEPLVSPTSPVTFDCTKFIRVVEIIVNPAYLNDPDRNEGDVGILRLETPQTANPATLPVRNRVKHLPKNQSLTYVAFRRIQDPSLPSGFDLTTIRRRFAPATTKKPDPQRRAGAVVDRRDGPLHHERQFGRARLPRRDQRDHLARHLPARGVPRRASVPEAGRRQRARLPGGVRHPALRRGLRAGSRMRDNRPSLETSFLNVKP